jgi:hypothetical protein
MASWSSSVAMTKFALENHCRISSVGMHLLRPPCCLPPASTPPFLPPLSPASNTDLRGLSSNPVRNLRSLPDRSPSQNEWGVDGGAVDDRLLKGGFVQLLCLLSDHTRAKTERLMLRKEVMTKTVTRVVLSLNHIQ